MLPILPLEEPHPAPMTPPGRPTSKPNPPRSEANASDVFVAPVFHHLARRGGVLADGTTCPPSLLPFVESFDFAVLATALQERPFLYFHPAVRVQIDWLLHLLNDEELWQRTEWEIHFDDNGHAQPPCEVNRVEEILQQLVRAHVRALLPDMVIAPERVRKKSGRKGGFKNPHPMRDPDTAWIDPGTLYATWRPLREGFDSPHAKKLLRKMPARPSADYVHRVVVLAHEIIALAYEDDDPPRWSALMRWIPIGEPPPGMSDDNRDLWLEYRQTYEMRTKVDLEPIITVALSPAQRARMRKAGCAGYLASAVLAPHLGLAKPDRVQNSVENYLSARSS
jgi:hypothetical protein